DRGFSRRGEVLPGAPPSALHRPLTAATPREGGVGDAIVMPLMRTVDVHFLHRVPDHAGGASRNSRACRFGVSQTKTQGLAPRLHDSRACTSAPPCASC